MQNSNTQKDNVVSLFAHRQAPKQAEEQANADETEDFDSTMDRNAKNAERLRRERNQANKSVLRSYRIKN